MRRYDCVVVLFVAVLALVAFAPSDGLAQAKGDAKAGEAAYTANKCANCHGEKGAGDGPVGQKLKDKPSNWTAAGGGLKGMADQKIYDSIAKGGKAIGKAAAMPAYSKLSEAEVWNLVAYVKSLMK